MTKWRLALSLSAVLLAVVAAVAFAAASGSGTNSTAGSGPALGAKSGDPDANANAKDTATVEKGPAAVTAAEQAAAQRAYPADEVSLAATLDAQHAWGPVANRKGRNKPGAWSLTGPEHANKPGPLDI